MDEPIKNNFSNLPDFLTVEETALLARVSEVSVRRWMATGQLRKVKFGGATRIAREDLIAFTASSGSAHRQGGAR